MERYHSPTTVSPRLWKFNAAALLTLAVMMFSTAFSQPQTAVTLSSASQFVILAGSMVTNVPTSAVTGDVGLSPAAGSSITGFGLTELTGKFYVVDATGPVGAIIDAVKMTAAKSDLTIAYNDAAGRTPIPTGSFLNPGSGNMGGLTLVPGLYKFTSNAAITGSDLTLTGSATDVWIFQIAAALNVGNGIHVVLAGGAQASNIFWQVGTSATLGTTTIFKGTILADQSITIGTGSALEGRALARIAAVTLASSTITRPVLVIPSVYDNPDSVVAKLSSSVITMDGKLTESDWATANTLVFGPANAPKTGTEKTVTGSFDVKATFALNTVTYHLPYKDTTYTKVKFLAKGDNLYIGIQSPDKSICKFDWEADGMFLKIKNAAGNDVEYKLYWQNTGANKDTMKYEEGVTNSGSGAGSLNAGSSANDTTNTDNGYTAEFMIKLTSLGYVPGNNKLGLSVAMTIFDPDGYQHPMDLYDSTRGTYYKSWWGSEWGGVYKTIAFPKTTGVAGSIEVPGTFALQQNYPNPFNPSTTIGYSIPSAAHVSLTVYSILGERVATLVNGVMPAGTYSVPFNGNNGTGHLASGIYFYTLEAGSFTATKKLILMK